jgi:hypothetical protein
MAEFLSKFSKKEKNFFYVTLVIAFVALFDRLFLGPVMSKLQMVDESIVREKVSIAQDLKYLSYKDNITGKIETLSKFFAKGSTEPGVVNGEFLGVIEKLARESNIKLIKSNPIDPKKEKAYTEYFTNVECSGTLEDVLKFMHAVDSSNELMKVSKFVMSPKRGVDNEINLSLTIVKMVIAGIDTGKTKS